MLPVLLGALVLLALSRKAPASAPDASVVPVGRAGGTLTPINVADAPAAPVAPPAPTGLGGAGLLPPKAPAAGFAPAKLAPFVPATVVVAQNLPSASFPPVAEFTAAARNVPLVQPTPVPSGVLDGFKLAAVPVPLEVAKAVVEAKAPPAPPPAVALPPAVAVPPKVSFPVAPVALELPVAKAVPVAVPKLDFNPPGSVFQAAKPLVPVAVELPKPVALPVASPKPVVAAAPAPVVAPVLAAPKPSALVGVKPAVAPVGVGKPKL